MLQAPLGTHVNPSASNSWQGTFTSSMAQHSFPVGQSCKIGFSENKIFLVKSKGFLVKSINYLQIQIFHYQRKACNNSLECTYEKNRKLNFHC